MIESLIIKDSGYFLLILVPLWQFITFLDPLWNNKKWFFHKNLVLNIKSYELSNSDYINTKLAWLVSIPLFIKGSNKNGQQMWEWMKTTGNNTFTNQKFKVCTYCKNEMVLSEEDILYDKAWYHKECWPLKS